MKKVLMGILVLICCLTMTACDGLANTDSAYSIVEIVSSEDAISNDGSENDESAESNKVEQIQTPVVESEPTHTHSFSEPTCITPKKCSCGVVEGNALGHNYNAGKCARCGNEDPNYVKEPTFEEVRKHLLETVKTQGTYDSEDNSYIGKIATDDYGYTALKYSVSDDSLSIMRVTDLLSAVTTTTFGLGDSYELKVSYKEENVVGDSIFVFGYTDKTTFKSTTPITFSSGTMITDGGVGKITDGTEYSNDMRREVSSALYGLRKFLDNAGYSLKVLGFLVY